MVKRGIFFCMNDILKKVADTVTDTPIKITVGIRPQSRIHAWLQKIGAMPKVRTFMVYQTTLGNLIRISGLLVSMDGDIMTIVKDGYKAVDEYGPIFSRIVAIAIHNKKSEPPKKLLDFIDANITPAELADLLGVVLKQMNLQDFLSSIILTKGVNVLEMSRNQKGSSIAPGTQLVAS